MASMEMIQAIADHIAVRFKPRRIVLFGSHARGDADEASDVDLLIEMDYGTTRMEQERAIRRSFENRPCALDIVVYTPEEIAKWSQAPFSLASTVLREGKLIYERY